MKIVITGVHMSPAFALIDQIEDKDEILVIGRKYSLEGDKSVSLEYKVCLEKKIPFVQINTGRLQRKFTIYTIPSLLKIPRGIFQSFKILRKFKPDVVVGFGGYISFPVVFAASVLRIPIVIHEQTLEAGTSSRLESFFAEKICISFDRSRNFFPSKKTILTGNPIRREILDPKSDISLPSGEGPLLYITGGSLGSEFINTLIEKDLKNLLLKYRIVHQTGSANGSEYLIKLKEAKKELSNDLSPRYLVSDHFSADEVGIILRRSNLVIGRAGINTVSELLYLGKAALLIPLPFSQKQEQLKNAQFLKEEGLAHVLDQNTLTNADFLSTIDEMIENIGDFKEKSDHKYLFENAGLNIFKVVEDVSKTKNKKTL